MIQKDVICCVLLTMIIIFRAEGHHGHHMIPIPFPYSTGGGYKHTSSVVNIPIHQERLIIVKKAGNHHHHHGHSHGHRHGHEHGHSHRHGHGHKHEQWHQHRHRHAESDPPHEFYYHMPFLLEGYSGDHFANRISFHEFTRENQPALSQESVWFGHLPMVGEIF
ncbi:histidine-rich glycoprotein-like [Stegodyphus dumicola]|uniref:histidine-rich glycoprotein-like n=1 Tax=Stegodyphus dumicola TaxID=202533 RepID=UPI0015A8093C|nr:histidine-rich glycoprotein-like [Stegodyphus dumicola]